MVELPEWYSQVDSLLGAMDGMADQFDVDAQLYAQVSRSLDGVLSRFDYSVSERNYFLDRMEEALSQYEVQLEELGSQKDEVIADLQGQLIDLRDQATQEIDELNARILQLNDDLNAVRQAYATVVDLNEDRAQELIETLTDLKTKYSIMVDQRAVLLASVEHVVEKTGEHYSQGSQAINAFANEHGFPLAE